jgi:hypothetical protein
VQYLLKARIAELEKQPLLGNGYVTRNIGAGVSGVFCAVRAGASINRTNRHCGRVLRRQIE